MILQVDNLTKHFGGLVAVNNLSFLNLSVMDNIFIGYHLIIQLVRWIRDNGTTIVMIEHNMIAVVNLYDRIIVLDHGIKIAEGSPKESQQNEQVIEAYLGRE